MDNYVEMIQKYIYLSKKYEILDYYGQYWVENT